MVQFFITLKIEIFTAQALIQSFFWIFRGTRIAALCLKIDLRHHENLPFKLSSWLLDFKFSSGNILMRLSVSQSVSQSVPKIYENLIETMCHGGNLPIRM